jgi:hypothetical protein
MLALVSYVADHSRNAGEFYFQKDEEQTEFVESLRIALERLKLR